MDVSGIGSLGTALGTAVSQAQTSDEVGIAMLKKTMQIEAQSAQQLLEALPQIPNNPAHLGNAVDVKA